MVLFLKIVEEDIATQETEVVNYDRTIRGYFSLFQKIRRSDAMFIFHFVPHEFILDFSIFKKFDFTLHFGVLISTHLF